MHGILCPHDAEHDRTTRLGNRVPACSTDPDLPARILSLTRVCEALRTRARQIPWRLRVAAKQAYRDPIKHDSRHNVPTPTAWVARWVKFKIQSFRRGGTMAGNGRAHLSMSGEYGNRLPKSWRWLLLIVGLEAGVALAIGLPLIVGEERWEELGWPVWIPNIVALLVIPFVVYASSSLVRQQHWERAEASQTARLMDMVLSTSREWLWAVGPDGRFTFSGPACRDLTGYEASELLGRHFTLVIDPGDLADALQSRTSSGGTDTLVGRTCHGLSS